MKGHSLRELNAGVAYIRSQEERDRLSLIRGLENLNSYSSFNDHVDYLIRNTRSMDRYHAELFVKQHIPKYK